MNNTKQIIDNHNKRILAASTQIDNTATAATIRGSPWRRTKQNQGLHLIKGRQLKRWRLKVQEKKRFGFNKNDVLCSSFRRGEEQWTQHETDKHEAVSKIEGKGSLPSLLLNLMAPSVLSCADQPANERLLVELVKRESYVCPNW